MADAQGTPIATIEPYGTLSTGEPVDRIRLRGRTLQVDVLTLGARVASILAPNRNGELGEIALGLRDAAAYERDTSYLGACVGRYANRIAVGRFELDGRTFHIPTNEATNALHGGTRGFNAMLWQAEVIGEAEVRLTRISEDGEMGFPGRLEVAVTYRIDGAELTVEYAASTSAPTVVNLTNHTYFNLAGGGSVEDHVITVDADRFLPVDEDLIPTGELHRVAGTPFDLRSPVRIGQGLRNGHEQLVRTRGYDHTFVLWSDAELAGDSPVSSRRAAHVEDPATERYVELWTDRPGVQVYSGNFLDGTVVGRDGLTYRQGDAFCLEPQHFPDSPNHPDFPSTVLRPGETYRARDTYRFGERGT